MSTPLYNALVAKVRDWANRDAESLPDSIIQDALSYASETAYRELRVQGMESVYTFTATSNGNTFDIPDDLKEFISLRQISSSYSEYDQITNYIFTASASQTSFSGKDDNNVTLSYEEGAVLVILNGIFLAPADYTATDGLSIQLTTAASLNDELQVISIGSVVDTPSTNVFSYTSTSGQTSFSGVDNLGNSLKYKVNNILVTKNGVFLINGTDYTATDQSTVVLTVGAATNDLIEIVTVNELAQTTSGFSTTEDNTVVYDNKSDYRSFMSDDANQYSYYRWTRQADKIIVHPAFAKGDKFELYYYSDGSTLGTDYDVTAANFSLGYLTYSETATSEYLYFKSTVTTPDPVTDTASNLSSATYNTIKYFDGNEKPHYLRDNQERLLLYIALTFINDYLGEDTQASKYETKSAQLIQRINNAEVFKQSSGGNVRMNFKSNLI